MKQLLKTLTETFGPSGYEDAVRKVILKRKSSLLLMKCAWMRWAI